MKNNLTRLTLITSVALAAACGGTTEPDPTQTEQAFCKEMLGTDDAPVCVLEGEYLSDLTLTADQRYLLRGGVFIGDDAATTVLTIDPGVTLYGETSSKAFLAIRRGSQIFAEGTQDAPIVFTSAVAEGERARGDWGGLIINGRATINICDGGTSPCTAEGEGGTGGYGGDDDTDNSGALRYVRVEFAGYQLSPENELNGIAFQAVGSGTVVDHIQVHMGADDGVEFFGGAVNVKHVLLTGTGDDNLDWTYGWRGKGQFIVAQQYTSGGDQGIEADNYDDGNTAQPTSAPVLSNVTLIGSPDSSDSDIGVLLREGTAGHLFNALVLGFNEACLDISDTATFDNAASGALAIEHTLLWCANPVNVAEGDPIDGETWFLEQAGNDLLDPGLSDPYNIEAPDFAPAAGSAALGAASVPSDSFFEQVSYLGGVDPQADWTAGWTTSALN